MSKRKVTISCIGVLTLLCIILKAYLVQAKEYYFFPAWIENVIIIGGCSILLGSLLYVINKRESVKEFKHLILLSGCGVIGAVSYFVTRTWLYIMNIKWVDMKDIENFIADLNASEIPWLYAIIAVAITVATYYIMKQKVEIVYRNGE